MSSRGGVVSLHPLLKPAHTPLAMRHAFGTAGRRTGCSKLRIAKNRSRFGASNRVRLVGFRPLSPPLIAHQKDLSFLVRFCVVILRSLPNTIGLVLTPFRPPKKKKKTMTGNLPCMISAAAFGLTLEPHPRSSSMDAFRTELGPYSPRSPCHWQRSAQFYSAGWGRSFRVASDLRVRGRTSTTGQRPKNESGLAWGAHAPRGKPARPAPPIPHPGETNPRSTPQPAQKLRPGGALITSRTLLTAPCILELSGLFYTPSG